MWVGSNSGTTITSVARYVQHAGPYEENGGDLLDQPTASVELVLIFSAQAHSHLIMLLPFDFIASVLSGLMYFAYTQTSRWPIAGA
jgi:hypothetical protein